MLTFKQYLIEVAGYNQPHTQNERKRNAAVGEEEPRVRAKRSPKNLPSSYADKESTKSNSWKEKRKHQYR